MWTRPLAPSAELRIGDADLAQQAVERVRVPGRQRDAACGRRRPRRPPAIALAARQPHRVGSLKALSWHLVTVGRMILRRHLPIWMTSGMFVPDGAFMILNLPSAPDQRGRDRRAGDRRVAPVARRAPGNRAERRVGHVEQHVVERLLAGRVEHLPADRRPGAGHSPSCRAGTAGWCTARGRSTDRRDPSRHAMPLSHVPQSMRAAAVVADDAAVLAALGLQLRRFVQFDATCRTRPPRRRRSCWGALQPWQSSVPPQPSPILPQYLPPPGIAQVSGMQFAGTQRPPLQILPAEHLPQSSPRPQPSPTLPQYCALPPEVQVIGGQLGPPMQTPGAVAPPLHVRRPDRRRTRASDPCSRCRSCCSSAHRRDAGVRRRARAARPPAPVVPPMPTMLPRRRRRSRPAVPTVIGGRRPRRSRTTGGPGAVALTPAEQPTASASASAADADQGETFLGTMEPLLCAREKLGSGRPTRWPP